MSLPSEVGPSAVEAASLIRSSTDLQPRVALILGSGLGTVLEGHFKEDASIRYPDIPGFGSTSVVGHEGRLSLGRVGGKDTAIFHGRFHLYEGRGIRAAALIPSLCSELGVSTLIVTGAVGALVPELPAGMIVVIRDHLNMMGDTPLRGWRSPEGTPAFVNMAEAYDRGLRHFFQSGGTVVQLGGNLNIGIVEHL